MSQLKWNQSHILRLSETSEADIFEIMDRLAKTLVEVLVSVAYTSKTLLPRHIDKVAKTLSLVLSPCTKLVTYGSLKKEFGSHGLLLSNQSPKMFNSLLMAWYENNGKIPQGDGICFPLKNKINRMARESKCSIAADGKEYLEDMLSKIVSSIIFLTRTLRDTEGIKPRHLDCAMNFFPENCKSYDCKTHMACSKIDGLIRGSDKIRICSDVPKALASIIRNILENILEKGKLIASANGKRRLTRDFLTKAVSDLELNNKF